MLGRSVVFLTADNIDTVLHNTPFVGTAWTLAYLYLSSLGAAPLANGTPEIVGLSEGRTCYISTAYFRRECRFEDFFVHEGAHVFHNCKRETIDLPEIRGRELLLEIDFRKREMFAYACEVFSRVIALGNTLAAQRRLLTEIENERAPPDDMAGRMSMISEPSATPSVRATPGSESWKVVNPRRDDVLGPANGHGYDTRIGR